MVWIQHSEFFNNSAKGASTVNPRYGGAIMLDGATVTFVEHSHLCGNIASSTGGKRTSGIGGGLYLQKGNDWCLKTLIWENEAQDWWRDCLDSVQRRDACSIFAANRSLQLESCHLSIRQARLELEFAFTQAGLPQKLTTVESILGPTSLVQ